ncbi:MAG TPA: VOC family protein [Thermoplasmata archaeon]|nr:VOC family protein [Thermoplasmata archaeon]
MDAAGQSEKALEFTNPEVTLYSADVAASLRFYRDVLGFAESRREPQSGAFPGPTLVLGPLTLGLASMDAVEPIRGEPRGRGPPRFELDFNTEDVDGAYGWATSHGAPSVKAPYDFLGYIHSACVADPDGNHISFYTRLPVTVSADPAARPTLKNHLFNLYSNHIEESLQLYRGILNFTETFRVPRQGSPSHVEMELGALNLGVSTVEALKRDHGLSGGGGPPRSELVLSAEHVDGAYARLRARGVPSLIPPHDVGGSRRKAWVADPDGNPIQIAGRA